MQKAVEVTYNGLTLRGMLHIPDKGLDKYPFVSIYHGFSVQKTEAHHMFVRLSRELENMGIGSVRFDFGGHGESDGSFENMTATGEINEAKYIFNYMKNLECADKDNLFMVGMSMGGMVASIAAAEVDSLKGLVLWAPAANMGELIDKLIESRKEFTDELGRVDYNSMLITPQMRHDIKSIDVYSKAKAFKGDVLLVHGTNDDIPIEVSYRYLDVYGDRGRLIKIQGADHSFSRRDWKDNLINSTVEFLKNQTIFKNANLIK